MRKTQWAGIYLAAGCLIAAVLVGGCKSGNSDPNPGQYHQTRDAFDTAEDPPLTAHTRIAAGMLAESEGDFPRADNQYREALKLDPANHEAVFHLANSLTQQKHFPEATSTWQQYLQMTNNAPEAYYGLAYCYESAGQIDKAEETYRAGMTKNPSDNNTRLQYGMMLARQNRFEDAATQLTPILKPADICYRFGIVLERQGKPDQAKAWYIKALEQDPTMKEPKDGLARLK